MVAYQRRQSKRVVFLEPRGTQSRVFDPLKTVPMMGPLYLGTLAARAGYDVTVLNETLLGRSVQDDELVQADILCLSCMTATVERGKALARRYTALRQSQACVSRSIMGGIHATLLPEDVMDAVDQVFVGEAESQILALLDGQLTGRIVYGEPYGAMDDLPAPDFTLLKNWRRLKAVPIMTARGRQDDCHFFAATDMSDGRYRPRSVDRVLEDIRAGGYRRLFFVDDHFTVDRERARALIEGIKALDHKCGWSCQLRTDAAADPALIKDMREAGCSAVYIGFEPLRPGERRADGRTSTIDRSRRAVQTCKDAGIRVHGMFMFGADHDDKDVFAATSDFCRRSGLASVQYQALTPLPGTRFYQQLEREGRLLHKDWPLFDAMHVVFQPKHVTPVELQQGIIDCFSDFYSYTNAVHDALNTFFTTLETMIKRAVHDRAYYPSWVTPLLKLGGKRSIRQWIAGNRSYLVYLSSMAQHADLSHWYQFLCPWPVHQTRNDPDSPETLSLDLFCNPLDRE